MGRRERTAPAPPAQLPAGLPPSARDIPGDAVGDGPGEILQHGIGLLDVLIRCHYSGEPDQGTVSAVAQQAVPKQVLLISLMSG